MVQEAADLAKKRKVDMIARQAGRLTQLESLRALVRRKEEEVSRLVLRPFALSLTPGSPASQLAAD